MPVQIWELLLTEYNLIQVDFCVTYLNEKHPGVQVSVLVSDSQLDIHVRETGSLPNSSLTSFLLFTEEEQKCSGSLILKFLMFTYK